MNKISRQLIDWAIHEIETKYADDVCLLIGLNRWNIAPDGDEVSFNFFIPDTERGYGLAKTFIIDDIGYDLFPMSWERVNGLAHINEHITNCLADGVVLYARSDADRNRFYDLQEKLRENLANPRFAYHKGLEKINAAMELYKGMLFEKSLCQVRKASGYIAGYLSQAVATMNGTYFQRGPENQITLLGAMKEVPEHFLIAYQGIVEGKTVPEILELCHRMIVVTRDFFAQRTPRNEAGSREYNYADLAAWYEEGVYTFRRLYYYCSQKDVFNCFAWGCLFQQEFDSIQEDFGLLAMDLLGVFDPGNLGTFHARVEEIQGYIASEIQKNNISLRKYDSLEEFLKGNG